MARNPLLGGGARCEDPVHEGIRRGGTDGSWHWAFLSASRLYPGSAPRNVQTLVGSPRHVSGDTRWPATITRATNQDPASTLTPPPPPPLLLSGETQGSFDQVVDSRGGVAGVRLSGHALSTPSTSSSSSGLLLSLAAWPLVDSFMILPIQWPRSNGWIRWPSMAPDPFAVAVA